MMINSTTIKDVHLYNVESRVIIGYNKYDDEDYRHMRFHLILWNFFSDVIKLLLYCFCII